MDYALYTAAQFVLRRDDSTPAHSCLYLRSEEAFLMMALGLIIVLLIITFVYYAGKSPSKKEMAVFVTLSVLGITLYVLRALDHPFRATAVIEAILSPFL